MDFNLFVLCLVVLLLAPLSILLLAYDDQYEWYAEAEDPILDYLSDNFLKVAALVCDWLVVGILWVSLA